VRSDPRWILAIFDHVPEKKNDMSPFTHLTIGNVIVSLMNILWQSLEKKLFAFMVHAQTTGEVLSTIT
jgi:hypothetical protein